MLHTGQRTLLNMFALTMTMMFGELYVVDGQAASFFDGSEWFSGFEGNLLSNQRNKLRSPCFPGDHNKVDSPCTAQEVGEL